MAKCHRTVCQNDAEGFKHKETGEMYCGKCAKAINEACDEVIIKRDEGMLLDTKHCVGCHDDYYNQTRAETGGCWLRKSAALVKRQIVHRDAQPVVLSDGRYGQKNPIKFLPRCKHIRGFVIYTEGDAYFPKVCPLPPSGWKCTREVGQSGPCAAVEVKCQ